MTQFEPAEMVFLFSNLFTFVHDLFTIFHDLFTFFHDLFTFVHDFFTFFHDLVTSCLFLCKAFEVENIVRHPDFDFAGGDVEVSDGKILTMEHTF